MPHKYWQCFICDKWHKFITKILLKKFNGLLINAILLKCLFYTEFICGEIFNRCLVFMSWVFCKCIVALSIASHHLNLPYFISKSHLSNFSSFKTCNLGVSFFHSVISFWLILSKKYFKNLHSVKLNSFLQRRIS